MPNRIIKDSILTSETVGGLDDFAFRLFVSLICLADDCGRGRANPAILRGQAFPLRDDVTKAQVEQALQELHDAGAVQIYRVNGTEYFWLPSWEKHQRVRYNPRWPGPEEADERPLTAAESGQQPLTAANSRQQPLTAAESGEKPPNQIKSNKIKSNTNKRCVPDNNIYINKEGTPTQEEVSEYFREEGIVTDPVKFFNYYEATGWTTKGAPIKNWKALAAYWNTGDKKPSINDPGHFDDLQDWVNLRKN